ncbi:hypothetical protein [uncultured Parasphingorhabdus sp.]|mgnify:FL=1|uniref:hypothetical protein n=1 Tax=uncultured Parasphingorhabdus sp. TaxID=2709694 RepID=UPI0030D9BBC1
MRFLYSTLATMALATPAAAHEIDNARSIDIAVSGSISEYCSMGGIADMDFGNLERRGLNRTTQVAFNCNMPFTMKINGERGALTHSTMPNGQGPFGGQLPYSLFVEMPVRHPATQMLNKSFSSRQLVAGGIISSNGGIATDGMVLGVELGLPSGEAGLLAGDYSEVITITVSPI